MGAFVGEGKIEQAKEGERGMERGMEREGQKKKKWEKVETWPCFNFQA